MSALSRPFTILVIVLLTAIGAIPAGAQPGSPVSAGGDAALYDAVLPGDLDAVMAETSGELSTYTIQATIELGEGPGNGGTPAAGPETAIASGSLELRFVNDTGAELDEIYLRLYANDARYGEGGIEIANVTVDGRALEPQLSVGDTVATVPLDEPLAPGAAVDASLDFTTTAIVQTANFLSTGLSVMPELGTLSLAHWYPMIAGYDPETGWVLDPVSVNGDIVFAASALYDVTLTAPRDLAVVTSGSLASESASGDVVAREYVTGPAREFTVVADNDFASMEEQVGGTTVTIWHNPGHEYGARRLLASGARALSVFNERFGAYPFRELDLVELGMLGPSGIEYAQLVGLDTSLFGTPTELRELQVPPLLPEYITVHEVAHQWWYGLVGNNGYAHAFLDESLAEASTIIYFEQTYDAATAEQQAIVNQTIPYAYLYVYVGDFTVDTPTDAFPDFSVYSAVVYGKGGAAFLGIRDLIGAEAFDGGLRAYVAEMRFGVATPDDLRAALERASGRDLEELWRGWFETPGDRVVITVELDTPATPAP